MKNLNKELVSLVLIVVSGLIILGIGVVLGYAIVAMLKLKHGVWYFFFYALACLLGYLLKKQYSNNAVLKSCYRALLAPIRLLRGFIRLTAPYLVLQIHFLMYSFFATIIPWAFLAFDKWTDLFSLTVTTHIYIVVTLSVIIATLLNKQVKRLTFFFSPFRFYHAKRKKGTEFNRLTDYLLSENNVKFIIYLFYFIYLLTINFFNFQKNSFYSSPDIDRAVLQSFITFIALERLVTNLKELEFKPSEMIKRLLDSMSTNDKTP